MTIVFPVSLGFACRRPLGSRIACGHIVWVVVSILNSPRAGSANHTKAIYAFAHDSVKNDRQVVFRTCIQLISGNNGGGNDMDKAAFSMALLRILSGSIEVTAAIVMLRLNDVQKALVV